MYVGWVFTKPASNWRGRPENERTCLKRLCLHGYGIDLHMPTPPTSLVETVHSLPHDITALAHHPPTATPLVWTNSALDLWQCLLFITSTQCPHGTTTSKDWSFPLQCPYGTTTSKDGSFLPTLYVAIHYLSSIAYQLTKAYTGGWNIFQQWTNSTAWTHLECYYRFATLQHE